MGKGNAVMELMIVRDSVRRPDLFVWNGAVPPKVFETWLGEHPNLARVPLDLLFLWQLTGGGCAFETETVWGPSVDRAADSVASVNTSMLERGMDTRFVVFHDGIQLSAVDVIAKMYVELDEVSFRPKRTMASLDEWYETSLLDEYGARYGIV